MCECRDVEKLSRHLGPLGERDQLSSSSGGSLQALHTQVTRLSSAAAAELILLLFSQPVIS